VRARRPLAAIVVAVAVLGVPVHAWADDSGSVVDDSGRVWTAYDYDAFVALPQVRDFDRVIASVSRGSFRGGIVEEMEGDYYRVSITQRGTVTRAASSGFGSTPAVTYVSGSRACTRTAKKRTQLSLEQDAASTFTCRKARSRDLRGRDWAATLTPTAFAEDGGEGLVYLVRQETGALPTGVLAGMAVVALAPDLLANYGLVGSVPQQRLTLEVRPDRVDSDVSQGNGYGWSYQWRTVDATRVPALPDVIGR